MSPYIVHPDPKVSKGRLKMAQINVRTKRSDDDGINKMNTTPRSPKEHQNRGADDVQLSYKFIESERARHLFN